jgi:hypothetical protein
MIEDAMKRACLCEQHKTATMVYPALSKFRYLAMIFTHLHQMQMCLLQTFKIKFNEIYFNQKSVLGIGIGSFRRLFRSKTSGRGEETCGTRLYYGKGSSLY